MTQQNLAKEEEFSVEFVKTLNSDQLQQLRSAIDHRLDNLHSEELLNAEQQIKEIASRLGYDDPTALISDANQIKRPPKSTKKATTRTVATPKYWNKDNKSQTWAGRGKTPKWLLKLMAEQNQPREFFLIPEDYIASILAAKQADPESENS